MNNLKDLATELVAKNLDISAIRAALSAHNGQVNDPPLDNDEVDAIVDEAVSSYAKGPQPQPQPQPLTPQASGLTINGRPLEELSKDELVAALIQSYQDVTALRRTLTLLMRG